VSLVARILSSKTFYVVTVLLTLALALWLSARNIWAMASGTVHPAMFVPMAMAIVMVIALVDYMAKERRRRARLARAAARQSRQIMIYMDDRESGV
jgi:uncharacterized membrane protein YcjF (UPF0283 family)